MNKFDQNILSPEVVLESQQILLQNTVGFYVAMQGFLEVIRPMHSISSTILFI